MVFGMTLQLTNKSGKKMTISVIIKVLFKLGEHEKKTNAV